MQNKLSLLLLVAATALAGCSPEPANVAPPGEGAAPVTKAEPVNEISSEYKEGVDYRIVKGIDTQGAKKPFIVEYFWLGCPHCQVFEAPLHKFMRANPNFEVVKKPAAWKARLAMDGRVYYGLKELNKLEYLDGLFDLYRGQGLPTKTQVGSFLQQIDIEPDVFFKMVDNSDSITAQLDKNISEMRSNEINGVPAIVVNGKYLIISKEANFFELVKYLSTK